VRYDKYTKKLSKGNRCISTMKWECLDKQMRPLKHLQTTPTITASTLPVTGWRIICAGPSTTVNDLLP